MTEFLLYSPDDPFTTMIEGPLAKLLGKVAKGNIRPDLSDLPAPVAIRWGSAVVDGHVMDLKPVGASLELVVQNLRFDRFHALFRSGEASGEEAAVDLEDGRQVLARVGSRGESVSMTSSGRSSRSTLELVAWMLSPLKPPVAWIAPLPELSLGPGNLVVGGARRSLRVEGRYALHVVATDGGPPVLVIDTRGEPLDVHVLGVEARALEIALGRNIPIAYAVAVGEGGQITGATGLAFEHERDESERCPVPSHPAVDDFWIPVFYRHLAAKLHGDGEDSPLTFATAAYLDSLPARLDTAHLLLQVALEGFCKEVAKTDGKLGILVKDRRAWSMFIDAHQDELEALAVDAIAATKFINKLRTSAPHAPTTDLVETGLRALGVDPGAEVFEAVRRLRNRAAHSFIMSRESDRDFQLDAVRVDIIQTLVVAAMAKYTNYRGPIVGWDRNAQGWRTVPSWWRSEDDPLAHTVFVADAATDANTAPAT